MNNLLSMVDQEQNPKLAESIDKLSGLLRYVVYEAKSEKVTIAREIEFIKNVANLHLLRFEEDEIDFKCTIKGDCDQQKIEPGILLCYVENAFKHGLEPEAPSFIHMTIDITIDDTIVFSIENSIPKHVKNESNGAGGYGLKSNLKRLQLAYPNRYTLDIQKNSTHLVTLSIDTYESNNRR